MDSVRFKAGNKSYFIHIGETINNLIKYVPGKKLFIITDNNVNSLYSRYFPKCPIYSVKPGELSKNLITVSAIYYWLLENEADRNSFIVGIGGGVVCDLTGFVASTYMRGVKFGFVASTLLAQVDAAIGGKNGVNINGYKNIAGTINQPEFVICDPNMIKTIPKKEYLNGLAEIIKHSIIDDKEQFNILEKKRFSIMSLEQKELEQIIIRSVKTKVAIVEKDVFDSNERQKLNLGHTWGHGVEKVAGIPHGHAVAAGLVFSAAASANFGHLKKEEKDRIINLIKDIGLPVTTKANKDEVLKAIIKDKKKSENQINFVMINKIGDTAVKPISFNELKKFVLNEAEF